MNSVSLFITVRTEDRVQFCLLCARESIAVFLIRQSVAESRTLCRGSSRRVYLWLNARCGCLQNRAVAHICCANTAHYPLLKCFCLPGRGWPHFVPDLARFIGSVFMCRSYNLRHLVAALRTFPRFLVFSDFSSGPVLFSSVRPA